MCIWIPDWPVQRLALARPELHGRAVVLYEASPQGGLKVVAATSALQISTGESPGRPGLFPSGSPGLITGIYPGMPLAEAAALLAHARSAAAAEHSVGNARSLPAAASGVPESPKDIAAPKKTAISPEPHLEPADPDADYAGLLQLAEWCQRFSPITGVEDAPRPECLLLDVSGLGHLFGGEGALAEAVDREFAARGLSVRVALADTIGAAWAAAHALASELIIPSGEALTTLAPWPIGYLRVADETTALLATLGVCRIGQVAALPRWSLLSRFGPDLLRRLDQALGRAPEMIVACHQAPEYVADFTFEAPLANCEAIERVLGQLIARLTGPLSRRREGVLSLLCRLHYERAFEEGHAESDDRPVFSLEKNSLAFSLGLFRASASAEYLCDLLRLRLESVRLAGPVTSVQIEVTAVGPLELRQQALFDANAEQEQPRRLAGLVDRLSNRLGRGAVVRTMLLADAQPEYTCVDLPLAGGAVSSAGNAFGHSAGTKSRPERHLGPERHRGRSLQNLATKMPTAHPQKKSGKKNLAHIRHYGLLSFAPDERPLELLRQPARIEIVSLDPHGAPAQFRFAGRSYQVASAWGPERIETGWWRTPRGEQEARKTFVRRDYYRVETATGARFWIFRRLDGPQWFLHGRFA